MSDKRLVLVHAAWCPHCPTKNRQAKKTWESVKKKVPSAVDIEESQGKQRLPKLMRYVRHYPTVLRVSSKGNVRVMNGPFTEEAILGFYRQK